MVSKPLFARVPLVLLLFLFSINAYSQNISKKYHSIVQQNGILYFVYPQEGFKRTKSTFVYDLTYLTPGDSATLNFTIVDKNIIQADSLFLHIDSITLKAAPAKMFVEPKHSKWKCRFTSKFLFSDLDSFYREGQPEIIVGTGTGKLTYSISKGAWKKQYSVMHKIIQLIKVNQK
jgi:hypothetical protein